MVSFISFSILADVAGSSGEHWAMLAPTSTAEELLRTSLKQPPTVEIAQGVQLAAQEILDVDDLFQHPYTPSNQVIGLNTWTIQRTELKGLTANVVH